MRIIIKGTPITKKNSQRIFKRPKGGYFIKPSEKYEQYEEMALWQLPRLRKPIDTPVNVRCVYYMPTHQKVDLVNLLEATCDILVKGGVLTDDNCNIVVSHDGSRRLVDRQNPRVEITIEEIANVEA